MTASVRVLSCGIDTLHASGQGVVREALLQELGQAREAGGDVIALTPESGEFLLRPHGWRGFSYWLSSPRVELMLGSSPSFPPFFLQWHSAYLHTHGAEPAVHQVRGWLERALAAGPVQLLASRVDVYCDFQGWRPMQSDLALFSCRAVRRTGHGLPGASHTVGKRFSGFTFGRGDVVCRLYDKTEEMRGRGQSWTEAVWKGRVPGHPVWRLEFQFRRRALRRLGVSSLEQALEMAQGLWEYGTSWTSLRLRERDSNHSRWRERPEWTALRAARISEDPQPLVPGKVAGAAAEQLLQGFVGYASSLAALSPESDLEPAMRWLAAMSGQHLARRGLHFGDLVARKRERRLAERLLRIPIVKLGTGWPR
ncbi:MAG: hypothetical protein ACRENX_07520 [Candidatus Dormibacteria bacterium]